MGSGMLSMSTSPVRVNVTVCLASQAFPVVPVQSPVRRPSGCGCSVNTCHASASGLSRHCWEARVTANQLPPTSSNSTVGANEESPLSRDPVATHPVGRHTERSPYVAVDGFALGSATPAIVLSGPKSARYMPVNGPVFGVRTTGLAAVALVDVVAAGLSSRDFATAKTPPAISSVTTASAPIRTPRRRRFPAGGAGGSGGGGDGLAGVVMACRAAAAISMAVG